MNLNKLIKSSINEYLNKSKYVYHGTGKGQALNIQRDGYMKTNNTGEIQPSISFTNDINYAKYYAKYKSGANKMVILRTILNNKFQISPRILNNSGDEYITFENIPSSDLEIMILDGNWKPLNDWNVIFDEPIK